MRITKAELEALSGAIEYLEAEGLPLVKSLKTLLAKFENKAKSADDGVTLSPVNVENILVMYSGGKVVPVTAARDIFWIKQYQVWKGLAPNEVQVATVARWLGRQQWLSPMTIDQVLYKWPSFLARATAEAPKTQVQRKEFTGED